MAAYGDSWTIESQDDWETHKESQSNLEFKDGQAIPTGKSATFQSSLKTFPKKQSASSITIRQSPAWQNWEAAGSIGPVDQRDAPIALRMGPQNYWIFGRYAGHGKSGKAKDFVPKDAQLEGFDIPLKTTPYPNQFIAQGGLKNERGGYHGWQSRDMVNWVFHGAVTPPRAGCATSAELVDGKVYIYYDYPNDQDPHLVIDSDLTDGIPGKDMGMAFKDPSDGSDCAIIRDLDGKFHLILEDWSPIDASTHAWDSPLAMHAVSNDGIGNFKILPPAVDLRTTPTGVMKEYPHPHWHGTDPKNYPGKPAPVDVPQHRIKKGEMTAYGTYEVHEPEQDAFGDWAAISIGGQYYLFCDYDPSTGHGKKSMSVAWFTSSNLNTPFKFCGHVGSGHPDPDIIFAEDQFYLITQTSQDFVSPGPWVDGVEVRVGVDTNKDEKIDQWTDWQTVKESYEAIPGFAKQVARTPASLKLSELPEGYGFQFEVRLSDTTENASKPILDQIQLQFTQP